MRGSVKFFIFAIILALGVFLVRSLQKGGSVAQVPQKARANSIKMVVLNEGAVDPGFEREQEAYLAEMIKDPPVVEKVYDDGQMLSELEVAASEVQRKQLVKLEILRDVNEGQNPEPTEEERRLFAEMMAAEGLKSAYSKE